MSERLAISLLAGRGVADLALAAPRVADRQHHGVSRLVAQPEPRHELALHEVGGTSVHRNDDVVVAQPGAVSRPELHVGAEERLDRHLAVGDAELAALIAARGEGPREPGVR